MRRCLVLNVALPGAEYGDESSLKKDAWELDWMPKTELLARRNDRLTDNSLSRQTDGWSKGGITLGRIELLNHDTYATKSVAITSR